MKIGKQYLGRMVEVQWMDPNGARTPTAALLRGRAALATWFDRGVILDITDGVVLIAHSEAKSPGEDKVDEVDRTAVPESLIEKVTIYTIERTEEDK